jgi:hypothetical protein
MDEIYQPGWGPKEDTGDLIDRAWDAYRNGPYYARSGEPKMNIIEAATELMGSDVNKKLLDENGFIALVDADGFLREENGEPFLFHLSDLVSPQWAVVDE